MQNKTHFKRKLFYKKGIFLTRKFWWRVDFSNDGINGEYTVYDRNIMYVPLYSTNLMFILAVSVTLTITTAIDVLVFILELILKWNANPFRWKLMKTIRKCQFVFYSVYFWPCYRTGVPMTNEKISLNFQTVSAIDFC